MTASQRPDWAAAGELASLPALRAMAWVALALGRPVARLLLRPAVLYFLCFAPAARRHSKAYLQHVLQRKPTWRERFGHFDAFATVALDRIYFARGRMDMFDLHVSGGPVVDAALAAGNGAFMLGAHIGSFEALHAVGATRPGMRVAMAMYPDNARMVHAVLAAVAPQFEMDVIAIGRPGSTLQIRDWLDAGGLVGMLGDRHLDNRTAVGGFIELPFLGRPARFADGPLRLAQVLRRRVVFMVGLYRGGRRYDVRFETLADFSQPGGADVRTALTAYVARLEQLVHEAPDNWFNFYDYWNEDAATA